MPAALAALGVAPDDGRRGPAHPHASRPPRRAARGGRGGVPERDRPRQRDRSRLLDRRGDRRPRPRTNFQPFFARARATAAAYGDRLVPFSGDGEVIPGVTSLALPGHTAGHTGFRLASGGAEIVVFGDAVNSAAVQFSHPEAGLVFDTDAALAAETRAKLLDVLAADGTLVAGTHLPFPGIGHVARRRGGRRSDTPGDGRRSGDLSTC